jgi:hypothetical protein
MANEPLGERAALKIDAARLDRLGEFLMSQPHEKYATGVHGYKPSNRASTTCPSNGKTIAMLLAGHMAQDNPQLGFDFESRLYDARTGTATESR